jgi:hypothetical protein
MEFVSGGLKGGEWNSSNVGVKFTMAGRVTGKIGKIARTTPAEDGPGWITLLMYGCETCEGDSQQDCDEGIVDEPHWSPI